MSPGVDQSIIRASEETPRLVVCSLLTFVRFSERRLCKLALRPVFLCVIILRLDMVGILASSL